MSTANAPSDLIHGHTPGGEHGQDHAHPAFLRHHFDTPQQQAESASEGMWLFLATEFLLFAGLFCAYAVYRAAHPEIFLYAHVFLDKTWGAINTVVLLASSFTMAVGVWAAERGKKDLLVWMCGLTILGGVGFMVIKYIEYKGKWEHGLLYGKSFYNESRDHYLAGKHDAGHGDASHQHDGQSAPGHAAAHDLEAAVAHTPASTSPAADAAHGQPVPTPAAPPAVSADAPSPTFDAAPAVLPVGAVARPQAELTPQQVTRNIHLFFSVYFGMTGLHGLHVMAGMGAIGWIMMRALRNEFSAAYYTPVHMVGLYWHVVDLIWIYLFPLLYLIH